MGLPARSLEAVAADRPALQLVGHRPARLSRRVLAARRARNGLLWGLALFFLSQVVMGIAVVTRHPGRHDPEYWLRLERIRQRTGPRSGNPLTFFVFGSSRTRTGLRVGFMERLITEALQRQVVGISFSSNGGGPLTALFTWRRLQRDGIRPDLAVVEIHPGMVISSLRPSGGELNEVPWPITRLSWSDVDYVEQYAGASRPGIRREWLRSVANPLYRSRISLLSEWLPQLVPFPYGVIARGSDVDSSGQSFIEDRAISPEDRARDVDLTLRIYQEGLKHFRWADFPPGSPYHNLRELLTSCRDNGTRVALLLMPEGPQFRSWYPPGVREKTKEFFDALAAEYHVPLVDAQTWMSEEELVDSHHLTYAGATRFTRRLAEELTPLLHTLRASSDQARLAR